MRSPNSRKAKEIIHPDLAVILQGAFSIRKREWNTLRAKGVDMVNVKSTIGAELNTG
jgi:hypothetical protein